MKYLEVLLLVIFALIATLYFAREVNAEPGASAGAEPGPFHKKHITSNAKNGRVIVQKWIETQHKPYKKITSKNYEENHVHGIRSGKPHGHGRKNCFGSQCSYPPGKMHPLTTIASMTQPTVTSDATASPSNTTVATKSTDGNIGSNDATTEITQTNTESSDVDTSSTEVNMGLTKTGAGSTTTFTVSTAANTTPSEANMESTVSGISSTQATTGSTAATTTANPVMSLEEVLNSSSTVCIQNAQAGNLFTNGSMSDVERRLVFVGNSITPGSRFKLFSANDGNANHIYIKNLQNEPLYSSIYDKTTPNIGNENNAVQCASESSVPSNKICENYSHIPYFWIPQTESPEEIQNIIPVSNDRVKIMSVYDGRYLCAYRGDAASVIAGPDATDGNLLWTFVRCDG